SREEERRVWLQFLKDGVPLSLASSYRGSDCSPGRGPHMNCVMSAEPNRLDCYNQVTDMQRFCGTELFYDPLYSPTCQCRLSPAESSTRSQARAGQGRQAAVPVDWRLPECDE